MRRISSVISALALLGLVATSSARAECVGDCGGIDMVTIANLIVGVNIALGSLPASACPAFQNAEGMVDIAQLIKGVNNALNGCPMGTNRVFTVDPGVLLAPPLGTCMGSSTPDCTVSADPTGSCPRRFCRCRSRR